MPPGLCRGGNEGSFQNAMFGQSGSKERARRGARLTRNAFHNRYSRRDWRRPAQRRANSVRRQLCTCWASEFARANLAQGKAV
eukprot:11138543-Alexandrium_andersonii.AAC.1